MWPKQFENETLLDFVKADRLTKYWQTGNTTGILFKGLCEAESQTSAKIIMRSKILLSFFVLPFFTYALHAQVIKGLRAGVTFSNWRGDATNTINDLVNVTSGILKTEQKTGFFAGGYMQIPLTGMVSIEPGVYYAQKGYSLRGNYSIDKLDFLGINASAKVNSHYIDIPLVLNVKPVKGLELLVGPQLSYLVKSDLRIDAGALGISFFNKTLDMTDQMNRVDLGITGGIGYTFYNGFNLSASYDHGLSKLDKNDNFKAYNEAFKVGVGFKF